MQADTAAFNINSIDDSTNISSLTQLYVNQTVRLSPDGVIHKTFTPLMDFKDRISLFKIRQHAEPYTGSYFDRTTTIFTNFFMNYFDFFLLVAGNLFYISFVRIFLNTAANSISQPAIKESPPKGVTAPTHSYGRALCLT